MWQWNQYAAPMYRYASYWNRVGAFLLDVLFDLLGIIVFSVGLTLAAGISEPFDSSISSLLDQIEELRGWVPLLWKIPFVASGGTPGQRALNLRITTEEGGRPGFWRAVVRHSFHLAAVGSSIVTYVIFQLAGLTDPNHLVNWLGFVLFLGFIAGFVLSCFSAIGERYGRTLHDRLAGTYVIRT